MAGDGRRDLPSSPSSSRGSGSCIAEEASAGPKGGLLAGETNGDVCIDSGIESEVSKTKKASPPSPSFME